jgi:F0F1-type ATP synthase membrane subunit b/b'
MAEAQKRAAQEYELLITDAKQHAAGIVTNAEAEADGLKNEIIRRAKDEIAEIIIAATARVSGVGDGGDSALYNEFLKKAGSSDGKNGN